MDNPRMMGDWKPDPKVEHAVKLWREYYDACEAYDRLMCSGRRNGSAVPINQDEQRLINRNAHEKDARLQRLLREADISAEVSRQAKDIALREHERDLRK
jgi:hypothetical protein